MEAAAHLFVLKMNSSHSIVRACYNIICGLYVLWTLVNVLCTVPIIYICADVTGHLYMYCYTRRICVATWTID